MATFRQIMESIHPERINKKAAGGITGCPSWYGFERNSPTSCDFPKGCQKCWNREIEKEK